jgi:hypothetical protein
METWKPVLDFEDLYEVSDIGNVRRIARSKTLDAAKIPQAKQMFEHGATLKQVAEFLGTSIATAHSIKLGKTWAGDETYRPVKPRLNRTHYMTVDFCRKGKYTKKQAHRVVWEAFNGPIPGRLEVNHKNLNRSDNRLENLELLTHQQNIQHAIDAYKAKGLLRAVKGVKGFIAGKHSNYTC